MRKFIVGLGLVAAILIAAPAQAGMTVKNGAGGVGPPQWHFAFHFDDTITMSPSFVLGITAPGLSGVGLPKHVGSATATPALVSNSFLPGRPGANTITWHWGGFQSAVWSASLTISSFIQSAPGDVSVPLGGAFYEYPGGQRYWMTIDPGTVIGVTPEPATLGLMGAGLLTALVVRPRRKC